ncbi:hypothetical protein VB779_14460 [Haloarculaceae archaeon H-GB11]|nr:hypothetical protein [Haloarculaceae archaeon H-GB11]
MRAPPRRDHSTDTGRRAGPKTRAQASLPALAVALLLLTAVTTVGLALADGAFADSDRDALERRAAVSLSERLVAAESPLTNRANVLNRTALDSVTRSSFEREFPISQEHDVQVRLGDEVLVSTGHLDETATIRRVVLVERRVSRTVHPGMHPRSSVSLPRRTSRVELSLQPHDGVTIREVRADSRVLLRNSSGLEGSSPSTSPDWRPCAWCSSRPGTSGGAASRSRRFPETPERHIWR